MKMSDQDRKDAAGMQARMLSLLQDRIAKMKPMFVKIYADTYTEEELDGIVAFYKGPAGQAMLLKMPILIQRSMAMSQQMMSDLMPEIQKMAEEEAAKRKDKQTTPAK